MSGYIKYHFNKLLDEYVCLEDGTTAFRFRLTDWENDTPPPAEVIWWKIDMPADWTTAVCHKCGLRFPIRNDDLASRSGNLYCTPRHANG